MARQFRHPQAALIDMVYRIVKRSLNAASIACLAESEPSFSRVILSDSASEESRSPIKDNADDGSGGQPSRLDASPAFGRGEKYDFSSLAQLSAAADVVKRLAALSEAVRDSPA